MKTATSGKTAIYNIFADLSSFIITTHTKNYMVRYSCITSGEKKRCEQRLIENTPFRYNKDGHIHRLRENDITGDLVLSIYTYSREIKADDDKNAIMCLLQALEEAMADILRTELTAYEAEFNTHKDGGDLSTRRMLNSNREETGVGLLPRCHSIWATQTRQSFSYRRLDNYLKHIMVIDNDMLDSVRDEHIFLPRGFFRNFDNTRKLNVAASPITGTPPFSTRFQKNRYLQVFSLDYHEDEFNAMNSLVWKKILKAGEQGAEIVVFPEMLGNPTMESSIQRQIRTVSDSTRQKLPSMIVLPTFFEGEHNYCCVLDRYGNEITRQYKQSPYVMYDRNGEYMENITGSNIVKIFHYEGIGRFAIMICKDFLTTRYMERIMRNFMLTMIIVPAYSTGSYDFRMSFEMCAHDYCNVIWINSCAAMIPGKEDNFEFIGYVRKRIGRYQDESESLYKMRPCSGLLKGSCDHSCLYYDSFGAIQK